MAIRIVETGMWQVPLRTRMPFRYGIATMTEVPLAFVEVMAEIEGNMVRGVASDCLPPKWFTKVPDKPVATEIAEMEEVISLAMRLARGMHATSVFELWEELYRVQSEWAVSRGFPALLGNFGVSLVERALIEAVCRAAGVTFAQALAGNLLGIDLGRIHAELKGSEVATFLSAPADHLVVRHTIGLSDPLEDADVSEGERLEDGLPQDLRSCIRAYGLRHFKIKVAGRLDEDVSRLEQIARILMSETAGEFGWSLDGNEQFRSWDGFKDFWNRLKAKTGLDEFLRRVLFVEQPLHREVALKEDTGGGLRSWAERPVVVIDESDGALEDLGVALRLGYNGTSHKNCKGVIKGVAHGCLIRHLKRVRPEGRWMQTGEDLCTIGPVALLQDLAVMAALGIASVERNGHHYHQGLSQLPKAVQESVLSHHGDLYRCMAGGWPALRIERGEVSIASVNRAPLGVGFEVTRTDH